ncbi:hypothetical protein GM3708_1259 [Geminocystis sp. NIES-3708]|uniref:hypothetical protein n=1 Tax=Geminocystis sp. NIES-3708 TaxID=1615909 RepID=UPI0005FC62DB|nr:hypothetical protein [Geminocystis sp. NIES-3708]BAQ60853.1 hypothetical protein GM3708_1259 [Geminocystis sp. NIES-3708]
MTHSFLLEPSSWIIKGTWLDKNQKSSSFKGATIITWDQTNWFLMKTKIVFPSGDRPDITFEYKGFLPNGKTQYAYVLKRNDFEKVEGEGWLSNDSIIQRYWVLGDNRRLNGFETYFCLDENTYHLTSGMMTGNNILNTWEGILERHG